MLSTAVFMAVVGAGIVCAMMLILWVIHLLIKNAAIVDFGWAAGLALLAISYAISGPGFVTRKWMIAVMAGIWGLRLATYLLFTRVIGKPEEGRYVQLREDWKTNLPLRFLFFFEFQALLDVALSMPFLLACLNAHTPLGPAEYVGAGLWLVKRWPISSCTTSKTILRIRVKPATWGCGSTPGIQTIFLNG